MLVQTDEILIDIECADRLTAACERLACGSFDVVLSDLTLPDSQGLDTFLGVHDRYPDIPVIVLTASNDVQLALRAVQEGAQDYLVKGQFDDSLLVRAIRYSIERQKLVTKLEKSVREIKQLRGLLPMCAWCKSIRDDKGYWKNVETYIEEHTAASFTHGICPKCLKKIAPPNLLREIKTGHSEMFENDDNDAKGME